MDKKEIASFFSSLAETWDATTIKNNQKVEKILDFAEISAHKSVLDVACGTGVLVPDYINRKIHRYVGIDISANMIKKAKSKFADCKDFEFLCADAETVRLNEKFDCIVIYDAFPHFANSTLLFSNLSNHLEEYGRITVAHSMSRDEIIAIHSGNARNVSTVLPEAENLGELMSKFFNIDVCISDEKMYIVSGKKTNS